jgi:DNA-3-methyladenine glycosylase II
MHYKNSSLLLPTYSGSFELLFTKSLAKLSGFASQNYARPDILDQQGNWFRLIEVDGNLVAIKAMKSGIISWASSANIELSKIQHRVEHILIPMLLSKEAVEHLPKGLARCFLNQSPLIHIASASLGESLIKAIIRQVISATQAKKLLHLFITKYGITWAHNGTTYLSFPELELISQLSLDELTLCGFGYKARIIQQTARSILTTNLEEEVNNVSSETAIALLQNLKGVGYWTAHVAICDLRGDWSLYPFNDLAVRTWASKLWTDYHWPSNEKDFLKMWETINGTYTGLITFYLLMQSSLNAS